MTSTVISPPPLHEWSKERLADTLTRFVPQFRENTDRNAWDLVGSLEDIMKHNLWESVGCTSMEQYAREYLEHSEAWCHELVRIYREDKAGTVGEVVSKADRNELIHQLKAEGLTQQKIADKAECSQATVSDVLSEKQSKTEKLIKPTRDSNARNLYVPQSPATAAHKILDKFGAEFSIQLVDEVMTAVQGVHNGR